MENVMPPMAMQPQESEEERLRKLSVMPPAAFGPMPRPHRVPDANGQIEPGNIDLYERPVTHNPDGTTSSVRSASFGTDKGETLVPTVSAAGKLQSNPQAIDSYRKTGQHLGIFGTPKAADKYGEQLHNDYAAGRYGARYAPGTPENAAAGASNPPYDVMPPMRMGSPEIAGTDPLRIPPMSPTAGQPPSMPPMKLDHAAVPNAELASGAMPQPRMPAMQPPAQKPLEVHGYPNGEPQLPWWKRALDIAGSVFPIGREIESQIHGTPQNYQMEEQRANRRFNEAAARAAAGRNATEQEQRIQDEPGKVDLNRRNIESEIAARENKPEKPQDVVKSYSDALAAGDEKKAAELLPKVKQFIDNTQKPAREAAPNEKDKDISDYLEANKLPDTAASREKARGAIAQRSKTEVNSTDAKDIAEAIAAGDQPPTTTGLYRNAAAVRAELARKGFNLAQAESDWHATQKHIATLNGAQQERLRQAVSFTSDSLSIIDDLYNQWQKVGKTSEWKIFNKGSLAAAKQLPGEPGNIAHRLEAQINDLTSELGTVYKGGNSSTDESLKLAAGNLQGDWNEKTFKDALAQVRKNLEIRQNSIRHSQPAGVSANSPYTPQGEKGGGKAWNAATGKYE